MPDVPILKAKDFHAALVKYGCIAVSVRGSHHKIRNPITGNTSVVSVHTNSDVSTGVFKSTLRQLGIDLDDFLESIK